MFPACFAQTLISFSISLIYPQTVTLYQVDDQIYSPAEVALVNTFNTFLDAIDGVSLHHYLPKARLTSFSRIALTAPMERLGTIRPSIQFIPTLQLAGTKVNAETNTSP